MRLQITLRTLFAFTALFAAGIPTILIPGAYIYYLPMAGIFGMACMWFCLFKRWRISPTRTSNYQIAVFTVVLAVAAGTFLSLSDVLHERFEFLRNRTHQSLAAINIDNPDLFLEIAREYRKTLVEFPINKRFVPGRSPDLPQAIRAIRPISVLADEDCLMMNMTIDGGVLIAYRKDSTCRRVAGPRITNDLIYYHNPL